MENSGRACSAATLSAWVRDARAKSLELIADLDNEQLAGQKLATVNPLLWEIGHAAWFQEHWVLQHFAGRKPILKDGDLLYDSIGIPHEVRWDLPVHPRSAMLRYVGEVRDQVLELLDRGPLTEPLVYFVKLSVFHEDMHTEAYTYTRQTHGYRPPQLVGIGDDAPEPPGAKHNDVCHGDVELPGGMFELGASRDQAFVFDNEKWNHPVELEPFKIAAMAVTQGEYLAFVTDHGYQRRELWSPEGWQWRQETSAEHPIYWKRETQGTWIRRHFDQWKPLEPDLPVIHVNWYEADAYCRWANRRLPSEAEWEAAAGGVERRHYPWGDTDPTTSNVHMDWQSMGTASVSSYAAGDSGCGCRQMVGNVWEWTATTFGPYPGFVADPYKEYSQSSFGECKVLRGGCWVTRSRLIRNTWRNFYRPDRRDIFAGFRTCAL